MQYNEAVAYINDIPKFASKNTLDTTAYFLASLGNPQEEYKIIHIAGTNGKGSTCAYINSMLMGMGYTVGMFTSPHLIEMTERIQVNGVSISKKEFLEIFHIVKDKANELNDKGIPHPSFFEFIMIMSMIAFKRYRLEYVILETGLGGMLDSTNVIKRPIATIITSIGLDHVEYLGTSIKEIAFQKAGIIKEKTPLIYDDSDEECNIIIEQVASDNKVPCRKLSDTAYEILNKKGKYIAFSLRDSYDKDMEWKIPNKGMYQVKNAILALMTMEVLFKSYKLEERVSALKDVYWPGRMEEILPNVIIDGAHNLPAIHALTKEVSEIDTLVYAAVQDKDYKSIIKEITKKIKIKKVVVTSIDNKRGVTPQELKLLFNKSGQESVEVMEDVSDVIQYCNTKNPKETVLCIGSLYLVGEIKRQLITEE